jgi:hypothetical protein
MTDGTHNNDTEHYLKNETGQKGQTCIKLQYVA